MTTREAHLSHDLHYHVEDSFEEETTALLEVGEVSLLGDEIILNACQLPIPPPFVGVVKVSDEVR